MIKIVNLCSKRIFSSKTNKFSFSSASDPYYILGIDKGADFKQIKKSFFKLANQYHPDKNDSSDARSKFLLVKQAFQQIKMQKGLMKPQNFVDSTVHSSVRPNADQFRADQQEGFRSSRDYRIFRQRSESDSRYEQFNSSFRTIHDINDIKIKVEEGEMKDPSSRFNLQSMRVKITVRSETGLSIVVIGMGGLFLVLAMVNEAFEDAQANIETKKVMENSQVIRDKQIRGQDEIRKQTKLDRQRKIEHTELLKIISDVKQKNGNKKGQKSSLSHRQNILVNMVPDQKQDFLTSNQSLI